jgi:oligopeptide transport system permease protein
MGEAYRIRFTGVDMTKYIIRRLIGVIPTMFIIITLSFFIMKIAPGGPFASEKKIPAQQLANIERKYHLDEPLMVQYLRYVGDTIRGDLGPSFKYKDMTVNELIGAGFPHSMLLGCLALISALILGVGVGIISAMRQNRWPDYVTMSTAVIGLSIPEFVIGPLLQLVFALGLKLLPVAGWLGSRNLGPETMIMPVITLTLPYYAYIARLTRASMIEVLRSDFVRTARAKGLSEAVVIRRHVLKGALLPVVSFLGPAFAGIITGAVVVEKIFRIPGIGGYFVQSALNRDYTMILGTVIVYSVILIITNLVVDILYSFLDPRVAYK